MAIDVGEVLVKISGDITGLTAAVNNSVQTLGKISDTTRKVEQQTAASFSGIARQVQSLAGTIGVTLTAAAFTNFVKGSIDTVGRLQDLADQTEFSASKLAALKSPAEEAGSSIETFARAMFTAQRQLSEIRTRTDPALTALKDLKLNFDEVRKLSPEQFADALANAFSNAENRTTKLSAATALFGSRLAKEVLPVLDQMAKGVESAGLTDEQIKRIDEFTDRWTRFANSMTFKVVNAILTTIDALKRLMLLAPPAPSAGSQAGGVGELLKQPGVVTPTSSPIKVSPELQQQMNAFVEGIKKQNDALRVQQVAFGGDQVAATKLALSLELLNYKHKLATETLVDMADPAVQQMIKDFEGWSAQIIKNTAILEEQKSRVKELAEQAKVLDAAIESLGQIQGATFSDLEKNVQNINDEYAQWIININNQVLRGGALPGGLDVERAREMAETVKDLRQAIMSAANLGPGRLETADLVDRQAVEEGINAIADLRKELAGLMLDQRLINDQMANLLGPNFDSLSATIERQTSIVQNLIKQMGLLPAGSDEWKSAMDRARKAADELNVSLEKKSLLNSLNSLTDSLSEGLKNTIQGVELGTQSLGDAIKNALRNMLLSLQGAIIDKAFLEPLKTVINQFWTGFVDTFITSADDSLEKAANQLGQKLGTWLRGVLSDLAGAGAGAGGGTSGGGWLSGIGGLLSSAWGWITSLFRAGGQIQPIRYASPLIAAASIALPHYAMGGGVPIMAHGGEYVMSAPAVQSIGAGRLAQANATGKMPGDGGGSYTQVVINGDITPRQPNMTKDQIIQIVTKDLHDRGSTMGMIENRIQRR